MIGFPLDSHVSYSEDGTPILDRAISSAPLRALIKKIMTDGVLPNPSTNLQVVAGEGMNITVKAGFAIANGCMKLEEADITKTLDNATDLPRIDRIVIRLDENDDKRSCEIAVIKGVAASNPVPADLVRSDSVYDICLAEVKVNANTSTILQSAITDTRYDSEKCGIISAIAEFDTTTIYDQIQADLAEFKTINQAEFEEWFAHIRYILDGDVAAHLQNEIDALSERVDRDLENVVETVSNTMSDEYIPTKLYKVNDYCIYNNALWKKIGADETGVTPTEGTSWTATKVGNELTSAFGSLGNLRFGIDADGNYGYYKVGADSVTPFKSDLEQIKAIHQPSADETSYTFTKDYEVVFVNAWNANNSTRPTVTFNGNPMDVSIGIGGGTRATIMIAIRNVKKGNKISSNIGARFYIVGV